MGSPAQSGGARAGFRSSDTYVYVLLLIVVVFWALNVVVGKVLVSMVPPLTLSVIRYVPMSVLMLVALRFSNGPGIAMSRRNVASLVGLGILGVCGFFPLYTMGLKLAPAADAVLFLGLSPTVTAVFAAIIVKERLRLQMWLALAVSFAGVALVAGEGTTMTAYQASRPMGDLLFFVAIVSWALYCVFGQKAMRQYSMLGMTAYSTLFGTLILVPFAVAEGATAQLSSVAPMPYFWGLIFYTSFFAGFIAFLWWNTGVKRIGPTRTNAFYNLLPALGLLSSWSLLGEPVGWVHITGAVLVILGTWLTTRPAAVGK